MKSLSIDLLLAAAVAVFPRVFLGIGRVEAGRILILAVVYSAVSVLAYFYSAIQRPAFLGFAGTLLALAWLQSFPAGNHSAEIGLYIVFGALVLTRGLTARRSQQSQA